MARIFYVHWDREESRPVVERLRRRGHEVRMECTDGAAAWKALADDPPDVLVVSLERLPSHGRRTAAVVLERPALAGLPVVFVGGLGEAVAAAREQFPRARFVGPGELESALEEVGAG